MGGQKTILVPLDGSRIAETILPEIEKVAAAFKTRICLLRIVPGLPPTNLANIPHLDATELRTAAIRDAEEYLRRIEQQLKAKGFTVKSHVRVGNEAGEILDHSLEDGVDLTVMCKRGQSRVERWLVGGVAERVLRHATKHVLLVPCNGVKRVTTAV